MDFPKPTKKQIFNCKLRNYEKIFKYPKPNIYYIKECSDTKYFAANTWCIRDYGEEWYNNSNFWIEFIRVITSPFITMNVYIEEHGKDFISEFLKDFKNQIIWAEAKTNNIEPNYDIEDDLFVYDFLEYYLT